VVRLEARLERQEERLRSLQRRASCERGDVAEYRDLVRAADAEQTGRRPRTSSQRDIVAGMSRLRPGDVIEHRGKRRVVLSLAWRKTAGPRVRVIDDHGSTTQLTQADLDEPPRRIGDIELPSPYAPNNRAFQHEAAAALRRARVHPTSDISSEGDPEDAGDELDSSSDASRAASVHPVAACPDAADHVRAITQAERAQVEADDLRRQVRSRTESLARRFDRVLRLLEAWGYLDDWALTERGLVLARTYHECDLLVAEGTTSGLLDGLDAPSLAAVVSMFTYEQRGPGPAPAPWFPSGVVRDRFRALERLSAELTADEEAAGLPRTRPPDAGFAAVAHAWAAGEPLHEVLEDEELSGGDFVRNIKQLLDLLRQIGDIATDPATARAARQAADSLHRGVVAASSVLEDTGHGAERSA
jgi:ATP-dependent RNA helicase HelY